jgi:hypothetical protein
MSGKECEHHMQERPKAVFVLSPFGFPFDDIYQDGIRPILRDINYEQITEDSTRSSVTRGNLTADRADQALQLGFVMCQRICRKIQESGYILADITKPNPNVYYELGLSYALGKKIVLIGQQGVEEALTFGLVKDTQSYIHYRTMDDFKKLSMFLNAFKNPIVNHLNLQDLPKSKILNIVNKDLTVQGLHEKTLKESIYALKIDRENPLRNDDWEIHTEPVSVDTTIEQVIEHFQDCKICVIDTSFSGNRQTDCNPYIFFLLGLAHGFQKEAVPLTNALSVSKILPFDVRGLWHIFYNDLDQLRSQFMGIFPEIDKSWSIEQEDYLYKKFWDPFLKNRDVHIMTCARDTDERHRGPRSNIDKWDYTTVSELSHFLALKYPNAKVNITPPMSKLTSEKIDEMGKRGVSNYIKQIIFNKDCIIIGSPDVSDIAEIVLSNIHGVEPYSKKRKKFKGYVMLKTLQPNKNSTFYWQKRKNEKEGIWLYKEEINDFKHYSNKLNNKGGGTIYGVLIVSNNPFVSPGVKRKIMILSGFSGIATYAIAKLLTNEEHKNQLVTIDNKLTNKEQSIEIVIGIKYEVDEKRHESMDNRMIAKADDNPFYMDSIYP